MTARKAIAGEGYQPLKTRYRIEDPEDLDGFWFEAYACTVGEVMANTTDLQLSVVLGEKYLLDWNLLDQKGKPVKCDAEGLTRTDLHIVQVIVRSWINAIMGISTPLKESSTSGGSFPEESIPMELSSQSQAS